MGDENALTFGSLFAGIGGIDLGLERAGMSCRWQVEIDEWCRRVLAKHWPDVPRHGDIKELTGDDLERVDVVAGGFPCQPVSLAGERRAQEDERWLWPEFARVIRMVRPRYVLVENVPGLLTAGFGDVLGDLAALGYDTEWDCISAAAFGASHRRDRLFVVAHAHRIELRDESESAGRSSTSVFGNNGAPRIMADAALDDGPGEGASQQQQVATGQREPRGSRGRIGMLGEWLPEPEVDRVAHGVPSRVVRPQLTALGNAVVPQVAEWVGRRIVEAAA